MFIENTYLKEFFFGFWNFVLGISFNYLANN